MNKVPTALSNASASKLASFHLEHPGSTSLLLSGFRKGFSSSTESQNVRGWKGPLWVTQSSPPAEAGSPRAGCTGPHPGGAWISPEKETPQPPWAAWARSPSPSEGRSSSASSAGTSSASVCAHCPLSCCWAPLKRAWPHPPDTHPADICRRF